MSFRLFRLARTAASNFADSAIGFQVRRRRSGCGGRTGPCAAISVVVVGVGVGVGGVVYGQTGGASGGRCSRLVFFSDAPSWGLAFPGGGGMNLLPGDDILAD